MTNRPGPWPPLFSLLVILLGALPALDLPPYFISKIDSIDKNSDPYLIVLGTAQDAGSPQIGCEKACCKDLFHEKDNERMVVSLGLVIPEAGTRYLFEATPDIANQLRHLSNVSHEGSSDVPDGIFLTHAHIGHYTGLMYLGKEAMDSQNIPVFTMPRMSTFLTKNGPWDQLINRNNIKLNNIEAEKPVVLFPEVRVTPFIVPHRDEYSETVGYFIEGLGKKALFIPDIDKWSAWDSDIITWIEKVDYAFLDATFYDNRELPGRDMSEIPHPFVVESMELFNRLPEEQKAKVFFIHMNHTNPLLKIGSEESKYVLEKGFNIAREGQRFKL